MEHNENQSHPLNAKKIALFTLYGLIAVCLFITILSFNDLPSIMEALRGADVGYIMIAVLMVLCYLALYPLSLCILTRVRNCNIKMSTTYTIAMTEHFFNGITPLATGGQPFQAHSYTRAGVKISESTGLLLTNLLIYMLVTTGFSLTGLIFFDTLTSSIDPWWVPIIIVGYSLNFMVLVVEMILGTSVKVRHGLVRFIYFLCKFRLFRGLESKAESLKRYFEQVQVAFCDLIRKKRAFVFATLTKILSFAFLYASSFFILLSLGIPLDATQIFLLLSGTSFAITAVGCIPTPGASGGVEGSASQVFKSIILFVMGGITVGAAEATAGGVMLVWRLITYYFVMLVSLLFYIILEIYFKRKKRATANDEINTDQSSDNEVVTQE